MQRRISFFVLFFLLDSQILSVWYTMVALHRKPPFFQSMDDTLGVFHMHTAAGTLRGLLSGIFVKPKLLDLMYGQYIKYSRGLAYIIFDVAQYHIIFCLSSMQFVN